MNRYFSCFMEILVGVLWVCIWPVYGATEHDNYVYFDPSGVTFESFGFTMTGGHAITGGQPWDGITVKTDPDGYGYIIVKAGRKGSEDVAKWFNHRADVAFGTQGGGTGSPDKLNFAIQGDLMLKANGSPPKGGGSVLCRDIVIGQGKKGAYNNWWIGGKSTIMHEWEGQVWLQCPAEDGYCGGVVLVSVKLVSDKTDISETFKLGLSWCPVPKETVEPIEPVERPLHR